MLSTPCPQGLRKRTNVAIFVKSGTKTVLNGVRWVLSEAKLSLHADAMPGHHGADAARSVEAVLPEFGQHLGLGIG